MFYSWQNLRFFTLTSPKGGDPAVDGIAIPRGHNVYRLAVTSPFENLTRIERTLQEHVTVLHCRPRSTEEGTRVECDLAYEPGALPQTLMDVLVEDLKSIQGVTHVEFIN
jgi:hypothetical protein